MAPLVRRSWSPRGQTPVVYQRGRCHQKVSVMAALCVAPDRRMVHLYFRLHPDINITAPLVVEFLRTLVKQLRGPMVLIWDRLLAHRAKIVTSFIHSRPGIYPVFLPAYAPELNPVENVWGYLKMNPLANWASWDIESLATTARHHGKSIQRKPNLVRSFIHHCPLFLRLR
jgi:hypothetical protein